MIIKNHNNGDIQNCSLVIFKFREYIFVLNDCHFYVFTLLNIVLRDLDTELGKLVIGCSLEKRQVKTSFCREEVTPSRPEQDLMWSDCTRKAITYYIIVKWHMYFHGEGLGENMEKGTWLPIRMGGSWVIFVSFLIIVMFAYEIT